MEVVNREEIIISLFRREKTNPRGFRLGMAKGLTISDPHPEVSAFARSGTKA
jgi:hypothetical protein